MSDILEQKPDHHYRTEIPNVVFELGLCPFALTLYLFIKKVAGDTGKCWQSVKHLAEACGMGETKLKECKDKLSERFDKIGRMPLIKITPRKKEDGSADTDLIEIVPIWRVNGDYFRNGGGGSPHEPGVGRSAMGGGSPHDYKEEPSEEDPIKNSPPVSKSQPKIINPEAHSCALLLQSKILENKPDFKFQSKLDSWVYVFDLMIRRDGRTPEAIIKAIEFAQGDDFWMSRVLSPEKLRKQMDTLEMQMNANSKKEAPKESNHGKVVALFRSGERYNGYYVCYDEYAIIFQSSSGYTLGKLNFSEKGFDEQLGNMMRKLGIKSNGR